MKRVVVIGSGGSGKSTFSRRLGEITGLPVVNLDKLYWHRGWVKTPREEWIEIVRREIAKPEWIIDGNFGNTRAIRMAAADTIIMLDLPRWLCMYRILKRTVTYRKGDRTWLRAVVSDSILNFSCGFGITHERAATERWLRSLNSAASGS